MSLSSIETIVVLIMENRSFDHMLGHLCLPPFNRGDIEGVSTDPAWLARYANPNTKGTATFPPFHMDNQNLPSDDPPHGRRDIETLQLGGAALDLKGFVKSYEQVHSQQVQGNQPPVMGWFDEPEVPFIHFLAQNFTVCDHWFAPLPAGTQANRLMAMSGYSLIDDNVFPLPDQVLVYDWLTVKKIPWRVYHDGIPFFTLMPSKWSHLMSDNFRSFDQLARDFHDESVTSFPRVIFVEPAYRDAKANNPNDDHPPCSITPGQRFLEDVYRGITAASDRWKNTLLVVTYDEHGGFFDHVTPDLTLKNAVPSGASYTAPFSSSGVRVPALLVSPRVAKTVFKGVTDHTAILKLISKVFADGSYSQVVDNRPSASLDGLLLDSVRTDIPDPDSSVDPTNAQVQGFQQAAQQMLNRLGPSAADKHPQLHNAANRSG